MGSMTPSVAPEATHAVVVGIEQYAAPWDLSGPALDALRFTHWLVSRRVPPSQIRLVLAPLDGSRAVVTERAAQLGVRVQDSATRDGLMSVFTDDIRTAGGELLLVYWGGHGSLYQQSRRLLYSADASSHHQLCLEFEDLLRYLASTEMESGLWRQAFVVDSCATFAEYSTQTDAPALAAFPQGNPREIEQLVIYAASHGERAGNDSTRRTGAVSEVINGWLECRAAEIFPPDLDALSRHVRDHFERLRHLGRTTQTPISLNVRSWNGSMERLDGLARSQPAIHGSVVAQDTRGPSQQPSNGLTDKEVNTLADLYTPGYTECVQLLERAGFRRRDLPPVTDNTRPVGYWREISRCLQAGQVQDGRSRLLEAALEEYPANQVFQAGAQGRRQPAGQQASPLESNPSGAPPGNPRQRSTGEPDHPRVARQHPSSRGGATSEPNAGSGLKSGRIDGNICSILAAAFPTSEHLEDLPECLRSILRERPITTVRDAWKTVVEGALRMGEVVHIVDRLRRSSSIDRFDQTRAVGALRERTLHQLILDIDEYTQRLAAVCPDVMRNDLDWKIEFLAMKRLLKEAIHRITDLRKWPIGNENDVGMLARLRNLLETSRCCLETDVHGGQKWQHSLDTVRGLETQIREVVDGLGTPTR